MPTTWGHTEGAIAGKYVQRFELPIADHHDAPITSARGRSWKQWRRLRLLGAERF